MANNQYELLDSGNFSKLERFGEFTLARPDPQAIWQKFSPLKWAEAQAVYTKSWKFNSEMPKEWEVEIADFKFKINLSSFKHTGVFPEHAENWNWIEKQVASSKETASRKMKVLNLFGYTGGATLAAARSGAEVTHVDASKLSVSKAKENVELNNLKEAPIRWIVDDASSFLKREIKRGNFYDCIILDPPAFGRGTKGEVWKIEEDLLPLLDLCKKVLSLKQGFILLNGYASHFSKISYAQALSSAFQIPLEKIETGELTIKESTERGFSLPAGIYARLEYN
jgi:23S rRNA (cytosine1962-C5)-methyltransferase